MRTDKNLYVVLEELKEKGLTRKQIASKMGISTRTLASYYDYFRGDKDNRHTRKPKEKTVKKLKKIAQNKGIRTTYDIQYDPQTDQIIYISVYYAITTNEFDEDRFMILTDSQQNFAEQPNKIKYIEKQVKNEYRTGATKSGEFEQIKVKSYTVKTEKEFDIIKK